MDVYGLKQYIINNPHLIEEILEQSGFCKIRDLGDEIRCARDEDKNPTSIKVHKETLGSVCYSTNIKGDLITLVQKKKGLGFREALNFIAEISGYKLNTNPIEIVLPFGGFFKNLGVNKGTGSIDIKHYDESILNMYANIPNKMFFEDGIFPEIQERYDVGYDAVTGRITVPWYSLNMKLCGIMGRLNKREVEGYEMKWFPIIPFEKSKTIFGYKQNYEIIQSRDILVVGESEKLPMQLSSMELDIGLALGGCHMSEIQANHIKALFARRNIIAFDEGLDEEISIEAAKKIKFNNIFKNNVGYIYDRNNEYLPKGSKLSPTDVGKETFEKLLKNCTHWI